MNHHSAAPKWCVAALCLAVAGKTAAAANTVTVTAQPNPAIAGESILFTITPGLAGLNSGSLSFGDNTPAIMSISYSPQDGYSYPCSRPSSGPGTCLVFQHIYPTAGTYLVAFDGKVDSTSVSATLQVRVKSAMELKGIFVPTAAHLTGHNNVNWRTDLEVQNTGSAQAKYSISLLARGQNNSTPARADLTLDPGQGVRYTDILQTLFGFSGAGALCIVATEGTVIATSRTYAQTLSGTYGSFVPAVARDNAIGLGQDGRLIGLSHDPSLAAGFRTNVGLVNANSYPLTVEADFHLADGTLLGTTSYDLQPFEFRQSDGAFEQFTRDRIENGYVVVRMAPGAGDQMLDFATEFFAYASVVDNLTGDPTYVPAIPTAQPVGNIGGYWSGTADDNTWDYCAAHGKAWATFTQDGVYVTGTGFYGDNTLSCGSRFDFDGGLYGNTLIGATTSGGFTALLHGTLAGDTLELVGWGFNLHLHR